MRPETTGVPLAVHAPLNSIRLIRRVADYCFFYLSGLYTACAFFVPLPNLMSTFFFKSASNASTNKTFVVRCLVFTVRTRTRHTLQSHIPVTV